MRVPHRDGRLKLSWIAAAPRESLKVDCILRSKTIFFKFLLIVTACAEQQQ